MARMHTPLKPAQFAGIIPAGYRPDVDGLRAVSILAVVWYHAFPDLVPGGFVGVDIFFVISGYLITTIIVGELSTNSFSILTFYQRRIRRIFPALIVVLTAAYAAGWFILLPRDFKLLGDNLLGGAFFFANFVQLRGQDYFAPDAATNPLLHLWSLGIEEQFYIFWPLLLAVLHSSRMRMIVIAGIAVASLAANLALVGDHQSVAFYSPVTRAWELLAGALLARPGAVDGAVIRKIPDNIKGWLGLLLIALAIAFLDSTSKYPGWGALLPVAGAVLLLDARSSQVNRFLLSNRAMIFVGLVSYPLYLWHWPILTYLRIVRDTVPTFLEKDLAVVLSFVLACGTYYLVERPIRQRRNAVFALAPAMISLAAIGLVTTLGAGFDFRFPAEVREIAMLTKANSGFRANCFLETGQNPDDRPTRCVEAGSGPLIFVWGDSTAATLYPGLKAEQARHSFRIAQFTSAACSPILGVAKAPACIALNDEAFAVIRNIRPNVVLLHAMWNERTDFAGLRRTIAALKQAGIRRIVLLGPGPLWKRTLPFMLVNAYRFTHQVPDRIQRGVSGPEVDALLTQFAGEEHIEFISARKPFCNPDGCLTRTGDSAGDVVVWDQVHLSEKGSEFLAAAIVGDLLAERKAD
jgi:peptidoglycan/LPS O-acetylase OafA/YrhL